MPTPSTSGITGTDGIAPISDPSSRWTNWNLAEIFLGQAGAGRYVPKVDDYVTNVDTDERYKVVEINPSTLVPVLQKLQDAKIGDFDETDLLLGPGPGTPSEVYRAYLDKSVLPYSLAIDACLRSYTSDAKYARIFKGSELAGTEQCISMLFDQSGNLLTQSIPLELAAIDNTTNKTIKSVPVCHTTEDLPDGEVISVKFYSDLGHMLSRRQVKVENTAFVRSNNLAVKYVQAITLESPFLSKSDPKLVQYPLNVPLSGLSLIGVVHYSDGSKARYPVDGTRFSIFGFNNYSATIPGQKLKLVLKYVLMPGEVSYVADQVSEHFVTAKYSGITMKEDGAYSPKLFGYPIWVNAVSGYRMEWFLYNLDRTIAYRVTPHVKIESNSMPFDPVSYGILQHLIVSVNLKDVNGSFNDYEHIQTYDVVLVEPGTGRSKTNWRINFEPGQDPSYGIGNFAATTFINQNLWKVVLTSDAVNQAEWLERLYERTKPLTDPNMEIDAPVPNFFALDFGTQVIEFPISQWNAELAVASTMPDSSTLFVRFIKRTATNDLQLAVAALPCYQTN